MLFADSILVNSLVTAAALGLACAVLSIFVVTRRWAFLGEGISHAGFGGAGTAWVLMLLFPGLNQYLWLPYLAVVIFCLLTAMAIGAIHRNEKVHSDTAIGIFLVASLAWGFLGQQAYFVRYRKVPAGFENLLFGQMEALSPIYTLTTVVLCMMVLGVIWLLYKEIIAYCLDPMLAAISGVRAGFIHYLLILLLTITIVLGVRLAGSVLITALLILPGATALLLSRRLHVAMTISIALGLVASLAGPLLHARFAFVPQGPGIVLVLFVFFLMAYGWTGVVRRGK